MANVIGTPEIIIVIFSFQRTKAIFKRGIYLEGSVESVKYH